MNVVIYARYSSHAQRDASIDQQVDVCKDFAKKQNYNVVKIYADRAISGKTDNRPQFQKMIKDAEQEHFNAVLVYQLDRFARNRYDSAVYKAKLKKHNVRVVSAKENITDDPTGILVESLLEGINEYYSAELALKVRRGMVDAANHATVLGVPLFGYKRGANNRYVIDEGQATVVQMLFRAYIAGESIQSIIKNAGEKYNVKLTYTRIYNILRNPKYKGVYKWGEIVIPDGMPAIIDETTFNEVQAMINAQKPKKQSNGVDFLLTTKIYCAVCGGAVIGDSGKSKTGKTYYYYTCTNRKNTTERTKQPKCTLKSFCKEKLEKAIVEQTAKHVLNDETIEYVAQKAVEWQENEAKKSPLKDIEKTLNKVNKKLDNMAEAVSEGLYNNKTAELMAQLEAQKNALEIDKINASLKIPTLNKEQVVFFLAKFKDGDSNDPVYQREVINGLVNKVQICDDRAFISYNYTGNSVFTDSGEFELSSEWWVVRGSNPKPTD